ncbi:phage resistance protein [Cedecea neteri]|nr:phage resistance protein [Cedecea neteri]
MMYRIVLAVLVFLVSLAGTTTFLYLQTAHWVKNQQHDNMTRAQHQMDSLLAHVNQSVQSMRSLIGSPCTSPTVDELRRQLAITPNVGNIELAKSGEVYCSSLQGEVPPGTERKEERSLYLTASTPSLPGHPFVVFHLHEKGYGLYTSTDGYYIRSILESASELSPVALLTEQGWMAQDGIVHSSPFPHKQSALVQSKVYGYRLSSDIDTATLFSVFLKNGRVMMVIFFCLSAAAGVLSFLWSGRPRTPEKLLISAMKNRELHPYYQPIVRGDPAAPVGCEVLVRWLHKGELIPPDQFIPLAEETGLIFPLTRQLIIDVTDQLVMSYQTDRPFYVSINISARHLASPELEVDLDYFLTRAGSNIGLVLEITEREIINSDDRIRHNMERLRLRGVRFALDDFGTGYSSLETLHHTPVELIKIDRMFTSGIGNNALCNAIIGNIVDLAKRIGAGIIAEGVETEVQVAFLRQQGEIACQGYLFSKPLPWNAFIRWLDARDKVSGT